MALPLVVCCINDRSSVLTIQVWNRIIFHSFFDYPASTKSLKLPFHRDFPPSCLYISLRVHCPLNDSLTVSDLLVSFDTHPSTNSRFILTNFDRAAPLLKTHGHGRITIDYKNQVRIPYVDFLCLVIWFQHHFCNYSPEVSPGAVELSTHIVFNNIFMINCSKGFRWVFPRVAPCNGRVLRVSCAWCACNPHNSFVGVNTCVIILNLQLRTPKPGEFKVSNVIQPET